MGYLYDTNLWIALTFPNHPHHHAALLEYSQATTMKPAIFCRSTQLSYLRIAATPAILRQYNVAALTNQDAIKKLEDFLSRTNIIYRDEPPGTDSLWHTLASCSTSSPKIWADAYLAAFAISGKLTFTTFDKGFVKYTPHGLDLRLITVP